MGFLHALLFALAFNLGINPANNTHHDWSPVSLLEDTTEVDGTSHFDTSFA